MKKLCVTIFAICIFLMVGCGDEKNVGSNNYIVPFSGYDLEEYVQMPEYMKKNIDIPDVSISEDDVEERINFLLTDASIDEEVKDGVVGDGDKIHISYVAYSDGKEITKSEGYQITIGSKYVSEELEKSLIGKKIGDTIEVKMQLPEDYQYSEKLAGKDVTYKITIDCKYHTITPKLNAEFVKENSKCTSVEEYREFVKQTLLKERQVNAEQEAFDKIWQEILDESRVLKYPEDEIEKEKTFFKSYAVGINYDGTAEKVEELAEDYAKEAVKQKMILYAIAYENDLVPNEKEMREYINTTLDENGQTEEDYMDTYSLSSFDYAMENDWISEYVYDKVKALILEQGV